LKKTVTLFDRQIDLTRFEFEILKILLSSKGVVFSRSQLLNHLRGDDGFNVSERAIDVQIVNLRRKLGDFGANIETIRGIGYKLKEFENEKER
ncbi:MAG: winged helix-turn-helix transcriptional regulator, partial [Candidatus Gastranaerophilales bacterium]|nr:winged helix-turn-helix transcriptional regulator [Candidatus Gastranaerophilales bacterium]